MPPLVTRMARGRALLVGVLMGCVAGGGAQAQSCTVNAGGDTVCALMLSAPQRFLITARSLHPRRAGPAGRIGLAVNGRRCAEGGSDFWRRPRAQCRLRLPAGVSIIVASVSDHRDSPQPISIMLKSSTRLAAIPSDIWELDRRPMHSLRIAP